MEIDENVAKMEGHRGIFHHFRLALPGAEHRGRLAGAALGRVRLLDLVEAGPLHEEEPKAISPANYPFEALHTGLKLKR